MKLAGLPDPSAARADDLAHEAGPHVAVFRQHHAIQIRCRARGVGFVRPENRPDPCTRLGPIENSVSIALAIQGRAYRFKSEVHCSRLGLLPIGGDTGETRGLRACRTSLARSISSVDPWPVCSEPAVRATDAGRALRVAFVEAGRHDCGRGRMSRW